VALLFDRCCAAAPDPDQRHRRECRHQREFALTPARYMHYFQRMYSLYILHHLTLLAMSSSLLLRVKRT
jgi:hypothetical protein